MDGAHDELDAIARALDVRAKNVHKLGGYPTFVQEYEREYVHQVFQIETGTPFDVNFGDAGAGHLLACGSGASLGYTFNWSCH